MGLLQLFINKKTYDGICKLELNPDDNYLNMKFSIYELSKQLGYNGIGNRTKNKILESIEILSCTSLISVYSGGIYDYKVKNI
jgi:hypothetical protein